MNDTASSGPDTADDPDFLLFRERVRGTNISEQTLLATDYLNHFNEIVMMLDMVPDMPDLLEDAKEWRPKTYPEHFRDSSFSDKDLAVEAYDHVPGRYKLPFEKTVEQMNALVETTLDRLDKVVGDGEVEKIRINATVGSQMIQRLMDHANAIIHGSEHVMDQSEIDLFLEG